MICVDASVAVKWILDEKRSDIARALYRSLTEANREIIAPPLLPLEVTNVLRQRTRLADGISLEVAMKLLEEFLALPISIFSPDDLSLHALALAHRFNMPAAYDAHYLALADHLGCELWTDDERLVRRIANDLAFVRQLRDYAPSPAQ